jgi:hypothetical protein
LQGLEKSGRNQGVSPSQKLHKLLQRTMEALDTPFERLVFLASIRDSYSGRYLHEGWAQTAGAEEIHETARQMHNAAFHSLLQATLLELGEAVRQHFQTLSGEEGRMARAWLETEPFREMLPAGCTVMEREFFVSQMRLALALVAESATSSALPPSDASPLRPPALPLRPRRGA